MIDRQSGDYRPYDGRYPVSVCRRFFDKLSSTDRLVIVDRFTPDDRATIGRYMMKKSSKRRPIVGRSSGDHRPDASPMTKPLKIVGSVNETFNLGAPTKKVVGRPKFFSKIGADVGRQSADVARFSHYWLTDRRATVGLGNVTVV